MEMMDNHHQNVLYIFKNRNTQSYIHDCVLRLNFMSDTLYFYFDKLFDSLPCMIKGKGVARTRGGGIVSPNHSIVNGLAEDVKFNASQP